jgi:seryl-tRNA synthetase
MINLEELRKDPKDFARRVARKGYALDTDAILSLDDTRRELIREIEGLRAESNRIAEKGKDTTVEDRERGKHLKEQVKIKQDELENIEEQFRTRVFEIPNPPLDEMSEGAGEDDNVVLRTWGEIPKFGFEPKDHLELGELHDIIDVKRASKVTGTGFVYLKNEAAWLQLALINFAFETLSDSSVLKALGDTTQKGFVPVFPPQLIKPEVYRGTGRLSPEVEEERYRLAKDELYLIGSSEHTLAPLHMDEIIDETDLPRRYLGYSTCFRREAGSYGKDTRGILRVHQFDKLEMESFTIPEDSYKEHKFFVALQEHLVQKLEIPHQVVQVCTGDTGKPNANQIDINCWIPTQQKYRETHSADYIGDYQARGLNTRVRRKDGTIEVAHTNDATVLAIGRTLIAILENFQAEDGSVKIPEVLHKYLSFTEIRRKNG